jgi:trimethylamine--corrinoid protein Co-methyltransferase
VYHAAGWLEGGLTFGYEKFITDIEALQTVAELCTKTEATEAEIGFNALKEVEPGGHFFATKHTMDRYATAFYSPLVSDLSNNGSWVKSGAKTADERATDIWEDTLKNYVQPDTGKEVADRLANFIEKRSLEGGAPIIE